MTHVIYNISIILILISITLLTHSLTKIYNKCPIVQQKQEINQNIINQDRPSKIFNKMFNSPDIWMGYADFDTKDFIKK